MHPNRTILKGFCGASLYPAVVSVRTAEAGTGVRSVTGVTSEGPRADYFPNVDFMDQDGRKIKFYDDIIRGRLVVINMMYTACTGICPPNTANLLQVQQALGPRIGRDVHMVSISLHPEFDSPATLKAYAKKYDIQPGWTFLSGKRGDMESVRRKLGFYDKDPFEDAKLARHTGMLRIGNERIDRWCMVPSLSPTRQIVKSILDMV